MGQGPGQGLWGCAAWTAQHSPAPCSLLPPRALRRWAGSHPFIPQNIPAFPLHPCLCPPSPAAPFPHTLSPQPVSAAAPSPLARLGLSPGPLVPLAAAAPPPVAVPGPPAGSAPRPPAAPAPPAAACGEGALSTAGGQGWGPGGQHPPLLLLLLPALPFLPLPLLPGLASLLCQQPGSLLPVRGASRGSGWGAGGHRAGGRRDWGCWGRQAASGLLWLLPAPRLPWPHCTHLLSALQAPWGTQEGPGVPDPAPLPSSPAPSPGLPAPPAPPGPWPAPWGRNGHFEAGVACGES